MHPVGSSILYFLEVYFLLSLPQMVIFFVFSLLFIGIRPDAYWKRIVLLSATSMFYSDLFFLQVPMAVHVTNSLLSMGLLIWLFFPMFRLRTRLVLQLFMILFVTLSDLATLMFATSLFEFKEIYEGPYWVKMMAGWPSFLLFAAGAWFMRHKRWYPGARLKELLTRASAAPLFYFCMIVFIQMLLLGVLFYSQYVNPSQERGGLPALLFLLSLLSTAPVLLMALNLISKAKKREGSIYSEEMLAGEMVDMLSTIRGQRHDFVNQVQTMHLMLKMNKREDLLSYMQEVMDEINGVNATVARLAELPFPAVAALLSVKQGVAQVAGIRLSYELGTLADASELPPLKGVDVVRIIGNLLDNAMDEARFMPAQEREVRLEISLQGDGLLIRVLNRCRVQLKGEELRRMFRPGFSTKEDGHSGLGLAVVQERAHYYRGHVSAAMEDGLLAVSVLLPCTPVTYNVQHAGRYEHADHESAAGRE
ncbi:Sensor_kinase_SpoOB-type, alpha-helical domain [Paenibacillaceae bacterium GAS479]|nr:Sensor_kinase_SpoOB-type, alpha-helical domain [Paenibacillaceae bacterium GAS479]